MLSYDGMISLPTHAQTVISEFTKNGYECYAVGGAVRDLLMEKPAGDWDFTTNATPETILSLFPNSFYDNQFGTVGIKVYDETRDPFHKEKPLEIFEITTFRSEQGYSDRRHPDSITWGTSLEEDLSRRDFTINAIATDGKTIIDPHGGETDITKKIIRTVGDPNQRLSEDALRMMRAIRIACQLAFTIEEQTLTAIQTLAKNLSHVSMERIRDELIKILASDYPADGIRLLHTSNLLSIILPELSACYGVEQKSPKRHHMYDVFQHSLMALEHCPSKKPIVRLATLLHDIGKPPTQKRTSEGVLTFYNHELVSARMVKQISYRLRLSKDDAGLLYRLVRWHQFSVDERQTDSAIRRIIKNVGKEYMDDMLALRIGDRLGGGAQETSWRLELFKKRIIEVQKQPFTVADLAIDGFDVMKEFSIPPSKKVGDILMALFGEVEEQKIPNTKEALTVKLKEIHEQEARV